MLARAAKPPHTKASASRRATADSKSTLAANASA
jgi:hypothetical protein